MVLNIVLILYVLTVFVTFDLFPAAGGHGEAKDALQWWQPLALLAEFVLIIDTLLRFRFELIGSFGPLPSKLSPKQRALCGVMCYELDLRQALPQEQFRFPGVHQFSLHVVLCVHSRAARNAFPPLVVSTRSPLHGMAASLPDHNV
mmetsp:Transcript_38639/g.83699  ORF Transcript_38639/g.83699 Transcript_38639/m.83699 type:complete len:146 (+) Transcript_38639:113-550(+)